MLQRGTAVVDDNGNDVEPDIHIEILTKNVPFSSEYQVALFPEVNCHRRFTVGISRPGFYLHDLELIAFTGNDVHLDVFETPVAFENLIAFPDEEVNSHILALFSEGYIAIHWSES